MKHHRSRARLHPAITITNEDDNYVLSAIIAVLNERRWKYQGSDQVGYRPQMTRDQTSEERTMEALAGPQRQMPLLMPLIRAPDVVERTLNGP